MWQKLLVLIVIASLCGWTSAQPVQDPGASAPELTKQPPTAPEGATAKAAATPPKEITTHKKAGKQTASSKMSKYTSPNQARPKAVGTVYVDPPYIQGWVQPVQPNDPVWVNGTGYIQTAEVQYGSNGYPDGWTYHSGGSYAYGQASSRCWVKCMFTPMKSGNYQVDVSAWQKGSLRGACGYSGSQFYAYRKVGVFVEGLGYGVKTAEEIYFNKPIGTQTRNFDGFATASKTFYLYAGTSYTIWGYTEVGGWSAGDARTWQTTDAVCYIGPFMIKGINIQ